MACAGCGLVLGLKLVLQAVGPQAIAVVVPSCVGIIIGPFPYSTFNIPVFHTAFETAASSASGISNALLAQGDEETMVLAIAGDGGTTDIGFQALSGAADRNENIIYCCLDNEGYMNTGIQVSSSTPKHAWTMTTPLEKPRHKKNMMEIMAAHKIPYCASACSCFPDNLRRKIAEARKVKGMKYIHIFAPMSSSSASPRDTASAESKERLRLRPRLRKASRKTCAIPIMLQLDLLRSR